MSKVDSNLPFDATKSPIKTIHSAFLGDCRSCVRL